MPLKYLRQGMKKWTNREKNNKFNYKTLLSVYPNQNERDFNLWWTKVEAIQHAFHLRRFSRPMGKFNFRTLHPSKLSEICLFQVLYLHFRNVSIQSESSSIGFQPIQFAWVHIAYERNQMKPFRWMSFNIRNENEQFIKIETQNSFKLMLQIKLNMNKISLSDFLLLISWAD